MKPTYWSVTDNPENWHDNPLTDPIAAAREWLTGEHSQDEAWGHRNSLMSGEDVQVTVHGWRETSDLLDPEIAFDGYEPGSSYFAPTKATVVVRVRLTFEVQP
jgi:hypothetical protein